MAWGTRSASQRKEIVAKLGLTCSKAPTGWKCTRAFGHDGPCAAEEWPPAPVGFQRQTLDVAQAKKLDPRQEPQ